MSSVPESACHLKCSELVSECDQEILQSQTVDKFVLEDGPCIFENRIQYHGSAA